MFEVIGERINTSREAVQQAVAQRDAGYIREDVRAQQAAGAHYIDVNAGARIGHETADMTWLMETIGPVARVPLCLDSPDPAVLETAFAMVDRPPLINSISLEKERFDAMMPFLKGKDCSVIALCMDDTGMPPDTASIVTRASRLVEEITAIGYDSSRIYIDPLIQPVSTDTDKGVMVLEAVRQIKANHPKVHITGGLSNISYGLPRRRIINRTFVTLMMAAGMDSAIIDPLDDRIMATVLTADMLLGQDNFCMTYLKAVRAGTIKA